MKSVEKRSWGHTTKRRRRKEHLKPTLPAQHRVCPKHGIVPSSNDRWWWHAVNCNMTPTPVRRPR